MGNDFYVIDDELSSLLINAHRELGILEGVFRRLPDCVAIRNIMVARECYFSRQIDYREDNDFSAFLKAHYLGKIEANNVRDMMSAFEFALNETVHNNSLSKVCSIALYGHKSSQSIKEREKAILRLFGIALYRINAISLAQARHIWTTPPSFINFHMIPLISQ